MTSCHMCLGLCCGFVVVSMETEHNFEHIVHVLTLQWHNIRKKEHCWNSIIRKIEHNSEDPTHRAVGRIIILSELSWLRIPKKGAAEC